jgi:hypothetical protein
MLWEGVNKKWWMKGERKCKWWKNGRKKYEITTSLFSW